MSLHLRILLGYGFLAALLVLAAAGAALGFHQLAADLGQTVVRSSENVRADTAEIERLFETYREAEDRETLVGQGLTELEERVLTLLETHDRTVVRIDDDTRRAARRQAILYGLLVAVALVAFVFLSRALRRALLDRLIELAAVAQATAEGDSHRRATVGDDDELGRVARQWNAALDARQAAESAMRGRLAQEHQLVLALLAALPKPAAALSFAGKLVASTLEEDDASRLPEVEEALRGRPAEAAEPFKIGKARRGFKLRPLVTPDGRPMGWLAEPR